LTYFSKLHYRKQFMSNNTTSSSSVVGVELIDTACLAGEQKRLGWLHFGKRDESGVE